jgi:3'-phosphoadenosine 5'-phosphosulfate sulfotransferase (PAPS reductase)/FAD synthetase
MHLPDFPLADAIIHDLPILAAQKSWCCFVVQYEPTKQQLRDQGKPAIENLTVALGGWNLNSHEDSNS